MLINTILIGYIVVSLNIDKLTSDVQSFVKSFMLKHLIVTI